MAEITQAHGTGRPVDNAGSVASWDGRIHFVVNNAGILRDRMFDHLRPHRGPSQALPISGL